MTATHDQGVEIYEGLLGSPVDQRLLAARVHWMVSHIEGREVLDVGSGQGLASLLLAREGRRVIGIDRDTAAVEWARRRAAAEQDSVRGRIAFEVGEAAELPFPDDSFDGVLIGAVLEQQVDPAITLKEALRVLRPGGRLVATALYAELRAPPFGEPLYLQGVLELLTAQLEIDDLALLGRYVALAGSIPVEGPAKLPAATWRQALGVAERSLAQLLQSSFEAETELTAVQAELERVREDTAAALDKAREDTAQAARSVHDELAPELSAGRARLDEANVELTGAREQLASTRAERDLLGRDVQRAEQARSLAEGRIRELQGETAAASVRTAKLEAEVEGLRVANAATAVSEQRRADAEDRAGELERELTTLKGTLGHASQRLASLESERAALAQQCSEATAEMDRLERQLAADRGALRAARSEATSAATREQAALSEAAELTEMVERLNANRAVQAERAAELERELVQARARAAEPKLTEVPAEDTPVEVDQSAPRDLVRRSRATAPPAARVLHLIARSLPHAPSAIALDRHALLLAQRAVGGDSSVMTGLDFPWDAGALDPESCDFIDGVAYYRLHDPATRLNGSSRLARAASIAGELLEILNPQVLHAASVDVAPLALELAERHSLRCVVELASEGSSLSELDFDLLDGADRIVALCGEQREDAIKAGVPDHKLEVIPAFVDSKRFSGLRRSRGGKSPVIGTVAYASDSPAVAVLREVVLASDQPIRGLIVHVSPDGEPTGIPAGRARIADGTVADVEVSTSEIPRWLGQMDIVIAATPHEALDAMAAARSVIGIGAATVVAPDISELPALLGDPSLRATRGSAARRAITDRNTTAAIEAYNRLYAGQ